MRRLSVLFLWCVLFCMLCSAAMAANQNPALNFGYTDFTDPPPQMPGFALLNPITFYSGQLKDGNGNKLRNPFTNQETSNKLSLVAYTPMLVYTAKSKLPGDISFGLTAGMPFVSLNSTSDLGLKAANNIMGDLFFGPFIGRAHQLAKDWAFHWMFEFDTYAPTAPYDKDAAFNTGANFWTFEPFLALRLQMPYGFELSTRQHYTFNTKNHDYVNPAITRDFNTHDLKAGDLWHFNFAASKSLDFMSPLLRFGVVGYYGQQLTDDEVDGNKVPNSKEKVFAIGPCLQYTWIPEGARKPAVIFSLKTYWESAVQNRAEGNRTVFRMVIPF